MSSFTDRLYRMWLQGNGSKTAMSASKPARRGYGGNHPHGDAVTANRGDIRGRGVSIPEKVNPRLDKQAASDNH